MLISGGSRIFPRGCANSKKCYYYRPQWSWGKVIFSLASVILLTEVCLLQGGCLLLGGGGLLQGWCLVETPPGWPLLQMVHILLECILVFQFFCQKLHENERIWTLGGEARVPPPDPPMLTIQSSGGPIKAVVSFWIKWYHSIIQSQSCQVPACDITSQH